MTKEELKNEIDRTLARVPSSVLPDVLNLLRTARMQADQGQISYTEVTQTLKSKSGREAEPVEAVDWGRLDDIFS